MTLLSCAREPEVVQALRLGSWPDGCAAELRSHVAACRTCSEIAVVTESLQTARTQSTATMQTQGAGLIWWRAQLRRRNAAIERIEKPILGAQLFALAMFLAAGATGMTWQARKGHGLIAAIKAVSDALHFESLLPSAFIGIDGGLWVLVPALATVALVSGLVVYLASEKS